MEPMAIPTISVPMRAQSMGVPLVMRVTMLVIMLTRTARAEARKAASRTEWTRGQSQSAFSQRGSGRRKTTT